MRNNRWALRVFDATVLGYCGVLGVDNLMPILRPHLTELLSWVLWVALHLVIAYGCVLILDSGHQPARPPQTPPAELGD